MQAQKARDPSFHWPGARRVWYSPGRGRRPWFFAPSRSSQPSSRRSGRHSPTRRSSGTGWRCATRSPAWIRQSARSSCRARRLSARTSSSAIRRRRVRNWRSSSPRPERGTRSTSSCPRQAGRRPGAALPTRMRAEPTVRCAQRSSGNRAAARSRSKRSFSAGPAGSRSHRCPRRTHACSSPSSTVTPTTVLPAGGLLLRRDGELDGQPLVFPERLSRRERWQLRHQCRVCPWRNLRAPVATTDAVTTPIYEVVRCERSRAKCSR
jgi:hypothetical protein